MAASREDIAQLISEHLGRTSNQVISSSNLLKAHLENELGLDSLDSVELLLHLEKELDIDIPEAMLAQVQTGEDLVNLVFTQVHA